MTNPNYQRRKSFFRQFLTVYGRKPVLEALQQPGVNCFRLHLADSNKSASIVDEITALARDKGAEICHHSKQELSRLSRNGKQDQGIAADIRWDGYRAFDDWLDNLSSTTKPLRLLALDGIHNPQNLGMIIRSATAGNIDGIMPLAIKASAGAVFRSTILFCEKLEDALAALKKVDTEVVSLASGASESLFDFLPQGNTVFILGNESDGVSPACSELADRQLAIPMNNGIESLNVAITAALISFR
jgi:23S rRNA (guanosine2251-2'-O)-methyltransferase